MIFRQQQAQLMDDFTYAYYSGSNRLMSVTDPVIDTIYLNEITYSSGAIKSDGKVYQKIIAEGNASVPSGQSAFLQANESITLKPNFHAQAGSDFHAKWVQEPNYEIETDDATFTYDAIGNLIADSSEGTNISWTPYGKLRAVTKADGTIISFRYDGAGNRVEKKVVSNDSSYITQYVRDASGNVLAIYQDSMLIEQPIYGSSRLGVYRGGTKTGERTLGHRRYELGNHLGNVLAVITDNVNMDQDSVWATVTSLQDYYSFGLEIESRSWSNENYRHDFNGKETDVETGWQDYGMRAYMKKYARFPSVDPLTKEYPELTPYQFASNTPIQAVDLDGAEAKVAIYQDMGDTGYQPIFQITQEEDLNGQTRANLRQDYPRLPKDGAVNIYLNPEGDFERFEEDRWYGVKKVSNEVGEGFKEIGVLWGEFFSGDTEDARVARGMVGGIVGVTLALPTGGSSLTPLGVTELGLSINQLFGGVIDATDDENKSRNLIREWASEVGGEIGEQVYDYTELGIGVLGIRQTFRNLTKEISIGELNKVPKEGVGLTKGIYDTSQTIKNIEDEE